MKRDYLFKREAAMFIGKSERTIDRLIDKGFIRSFKLGGCVCIPESSITNYLNECKKQALID